MSLVCGVSRLDLGPTPAKGQAQMGSAQTNQKQRKFTWKAIMKSTTGAVRYWVVESFQHEKKGIVSHPTSGKKFTCCTLNEIQISPKEEISEFNVFNLVRLAKTPAAASKRQKKINMLIHRLNIYLNSTFVLNLFPREWQGLWKRLWNKQPKKMKKEMK